MHGRKLLQIGYYWYGDNNRRWLYWAIPLIAVGVAVFVFAIVLFWYRHRRALRRQPAVPLVQPQPVYGTPVTGWPDYNSQYNNEYSNFSSQPAAPSSSQGPYSKPGAVEMGVPPAGYPSGYPAGYPGHQYNTQHY